MVGEWGERAVTTALEQERQERIDATTQRQRQAADPTVSAWVSANAGSGKTHVLVQRIIRLMLAGAEPGKILALTYTTAAAANMANRVFKTLAEWTSLDDAALDAVLTSMGEKPSRTLRVRARQLFARAIETPGGLKIQTIHAFCERVLHLFPFEANVPAKFEVLDDVTAAEMTGEALHGMLIDALSGHEPELADALSLVTIDAAEQTVKELIRSGIHLRQRLQEDGAITDDNAVAQFIGVDWHVTREDIMHEALFGEFKEAEWTSIAGFFRDAVAQNDRTAKPNKAHDERALIELFEALPVMDSIQLRYYSYVAHFMTGKGEARAAGRFLTTLKKYNPALHSRMLNELERLPALMDKLRAMDTAECTQALMLLVDATLARYRALKIRRGALDFADLIARTRALLQRASAAFVLYKLDAGIDHLLIDEAQDTSTAQWDIMKALTADFFAGRTRSMGPRSVFAVGDPKQSIYSFQGASPAAFDETKRHFASQIRALAEAEEEDRRTLADISLNVSFRSAPLVLRCVDDVFQDERARGVEQPKTLHTSVRLNAPAHVELWPVLGKSETNDPDTWDLPVDEPDEAAPVVRLANRIASEIARWLAPGSSERIEEKGALRPIRAGDIMVLVRRRGTLFERIIRALKERGIAVAGADRLTLNEHIAVLDLVSLGRAMLLEDDELALAEILTSPLFGLNETKLLTFAPQRGALSLEAALRKAAENDSVLADAVVKLDQWRRLAREGGAFTFYARVLGAGQARRAMLGRLGPEAGDAVDEFLRVALDHDRRNIPSLSLFLATFDEAEITIKRDMDMAGDQVRVMTVHGAKGLEAPVVILPDTCTLPDRKQIDALSIYHDAQGRRFPVWAKGQKEECRIINAARDGMVDTLGEEYRRLLYVAMTRAKDRLVVAGYHHVTPHDQCWYRMIETALADKWVTQDRDGEEIRVIEDKRALPDAPHFAASPITAATTPAWLGEKAAPPALEPARLRPSAGNEFVSGDAAARRVALATGSFVHRLLEVLPAVPLAERETVAQRLAKTRGQGLTPVQQRSAIDAALALITAPAMDTLFGPGSRGEVDIAGTFLLADGTPRPVVGQVDRLAVTAQEILIADYKTNARPPNDAAGIAESYVEQLALYKAVIAPLYPGRTIRCLLIYTIDQSLHEIAEARLEAALQRLRTAPVPA